MKLPSLYQLTNDYETVWQMVLDEDADLETLQGTLEAIETSIEVKAHNTAALIKQLDGTAEIIDAEIKRLQARKKAFETKSDNIKAYLHSQLEIAGIDKLKTATFSFTIQNNPAAVNITNPALIPASFQIIKYDLNRAAIKDALKAGTEVPGAELTVGKSLRIR